MKTEPRDRRKMNLERIRNSIYLMIGILAASTLISVGFERIGFSESTIILMYLLGVLLVASRTVGYAYGILASVIGVLSFNYFFTAPRFSLSVHDPQYIVTFAIMLIVALTTSALTARVKQQAELSSLREKRANMLYRISQSMLKTQGVQEIYLLTLEQLKILFGFPAALFFPDTNRNLVRLQDPTVPGNEPDPKEHELAERVFRTGTTEAFSPFGAYVPIIGQNRILGVILIQCPEEAPLEAEQMTLLEAVAAQGALAVEREKVLEAEQTSRMEIERERFRNTLLRSISHDLRTPLTGIAGATSTILDNYEHLDDGIKKRLLEGMGEDVQWLIRLVENLLSMTRLEAGKPDIRTRLEAVEEVVAEAVAQVKKRSGQHRISVSMPKELIMAPMDGNLIEQVLINLMDNGIKYTPEGSEIQVRVEKAERKVWFEVSDTGNGIAEADMPHLFNLFYTGGNTSPEARKGSGLGLAICQSIILAHHGEIFAGNRPDGGAIFRFSIPYDPQEVLHE